MASTLPFGTFPTAPSRTVRAAFTAYGSPTATSSQGKLPIPFPGFAVCTPSPCIRHYPDHLSTMGTPSPCASRRLGDPQVPLHITSVLRFPVRPACSQRASLWRRSLVSLITALTNSTLRGLGFKQFSLNHIQRSCLEAFLPYQTFTGHATVPFRFPIQVRPCFRHVNLSAAYLRRHGM